MIDLKAVIERHTKTEAGKKLCMLLRNIYDDDEFILGTLLDLKTDKQKEVLIYELESDPEFTDTTEIICMASAIEDGKYP